MANRERKNELKIYLCDDEQYILEQKVKASGMKSKSAFLRRQILYGFVYDIDYSELRKYNAALGRIGNNLNQIAKRMNATGNIYAADVKEVKELMKKYQSLGPTLVVATFGEDGSLVWDGKEFYSAGITPAEKVVNTVGAGDSFLAGFMHGIMTGKSIPECQKEGADLSAKIVAMFDPY